MVRARLLIVEDNVDLRGMLRALLEHAGYTVDAAGDGVEALEKIKRFRPEALVVDMLMPRMDGCELVEKLRADPNTKDLPILVYSGVPPSDERVVDLQRHVNVAYALKGNPRILVAEIEQLLHPPAASKTQFSRSQLVLE